MELNKIIKERYSVRTFKDQKVESKKIEELLNTLNYIPTATNAQPEKIYVLKSEESLEKIGKLANTYDASIVLLICADTNIAWKNPKEEGYNTSEMDGSIVSTYLMLKAWDLGLGSVWIRHFNSNKVKEEFNLPKTIKPICLLSIGYPKEDSIPSPTHTKKKPLPELIEYK